MRISDWSSDVCSSDLPRSLISAIAVFYDYFWSFTCRFSKPARPTSLSNIRGLMISGNASSRSTGFPRKCRWAKIAGTGPRKSRITNATCSRSEEHTSELQSLMRISYAVFCLKKKKKTYEHDSNAHKAKQHLDNATQQTT